VRRIIRVAIVEVCRLLSKPEMWANDQQRDGRPAEYRWHALFNVAVWLTPTECRAVFTKTRNPLKLAGVVQTPEPISAVSGPTFAILLGNVEKILLFNKLFPDYQHVP